MTEHDSESRRQRLKELQGKQTSPADGDAGDDKKDRLRRALAERQSRRKQEPDDGQRPLERFPKLREALVKRRKSGGGGDEARGGRFKGRRPGGGAGGKDGDAVLFARRYLDIDAPAEAEEDIKDAPAEAEEDINDAPAGAEGDTNDVTAGAEEDIDGSLQRLMKLAERLRTELAGTIEEIQQLKQLKQLRQKLEADRHKSGDEKEPKA